MDADLHDVVILEPQWITDLLASIITTKQNFVRDGFLKHSDLSFIWRFDAALHAKLLRLLERFEVSFQMPNEDRTLIPCMLPDARPEFDTLWSSGACTFPPAVRLVFPAQGPLLSSHRSIAALLARCSDVAARHCAPGRNFESADRADAQGAQCDGLGSCDG